VGSTRSVGADAGSVIAAFTGPVRTARARSVVATCICTRTIVATCRGRSLLITFAPRPLLTVFCPLPVRLRLIYGVPASVVVLLPSVTRILVNIAVVPGIHVAIGGFGGRRVSPRGTCARGFAALRTRNSSYRAVRG